MKTLFTTRRLPTLGRLGGWAVGVGLLLGSGLARAQAPAWQTAALAGTAGGSPLNFVSRTLSDGNGNVYVAGAFGGTATFGATTLASAGGEDAFVAKWSLSSSSYVWAVRLGGSSADNVRALALSGSVLYVAGEFAGSATFGSTTLTSAGNNDLYVTKLTDNGSSAAVGWTQQVAGSGYEYPTGLAANGTRLYLSGGFSGPSATLGPTTLGQAAGNLFVARLADRGTSSGVVWATQLGGSGGVNINGLVANGTSIYLAGQIPAGGASFGSTTLSSAGSDDVFVAKLLDGFSATTGTPAGTFSWAVRAGGPAADGADGLAFSAGRLYVCGTFSNSAGFGSTALASSGVATYVASLTDAGSTGGFNWATALGGNLARAVAVSGASVYVVGRFGASGAGFGSPVFGGTTLASAGGSDAFVARLLDQGPAGVLTWARSAGGAGADAATSVAAGPAGAVLVGGFASAPASFGALVLGAGSSPFGFLGTLTDPSPVLGLVAPATATPGSTIDLYGSNLAGTTAIAFTGSGGSVVTTGFLVNAAGTQVSGVVVPAGAGSGPLALTTAGGGSSNALPFTVAANGGPAWQQVAATASAGKIEFLTPDAAGNLLVAGTFSGTLTLGGTTLVSAGGPDVFVAKWNTGTGTYAWARRGGSARPDDVYGLAVSGGNIYVAGNFEGATADFGAATLAGNSSLSGFVAKLTEGGGSAAFGWAVAVTDGSGVYLEALAVSGSSVYLGGDYTGPSLDVGGGTLPGNASGDDGFVAKLTDNGGSATFNWAKGVGNPYTTTNNSVNVYGLSVQGSTVYLAAFFDGTVDFGPTTLSSAGSGDVVVARLFDQGTAATFTAALRAGGAGFEFVSGMAAGAGGVLYVVGQSASATWPGTTATGAGGTDAFVLKVTDTGPALALSWVQLLGSTGYDLAYQLAVNGSGVYVAGAFSGPAAFGPTTLGSAGGSDGFVARLQDNGGNASVSWARSDGGPAADLNRAVALAGGRVYVGGSATPAASFGRLVLTAPVGVSVATLGILTDPAITATAPAPAPRLAAPRLYPNPAHGTATLRLPGGPAHPLALLDALGREVRRYPVPAGAAETTLDLRGLPAGLYVLRGAGGSQRLAVE